MTFGRYRGQELELIPGGYLHWVLKTVKGLHPALREAIVRSLVLRKTR